MCQQGFAQDSTKTDSTKNFRITGGAIPTYNSLYRIALTGAVFTSFKLYPDDSLTQRSSMELSPLVSFSGAVAFPLYTKLFFREDKWRIFNTTAFRRVPDKYWGIGYDQNINDENEEEYLRKQFMCYTTLYRRIMPKVYAGINYDLNYTSASDTENAPLLEANPVGLKNWNSGLGLTLSYDSRDVTIDAFEGMFLEFRSIFYNKAFAGQNNYEVWLLDYRQYQKISEKKNLILAWQALGRWAVGNVPFSELSYLSSPWGLRAYFWGRYRDNLALLGQLELRYLNLWRKHGLVGWIAGGTMANNFGRIDLGEILPEVGIGYRFEALPRANLRVDFALGREAKFGLNVQFTESF